MRNWLDESKSPDLPAGSPAEASAELAGALRGPVQMEVARRLIELIESGGLAEGSPISEQALARRFGVSRTPVRAAIAHLLSLGLLERGEGLRVSRPSHADGERTAASPAVEQPTARLYGRILGDLVTGTLEPPVSESALQQRYRAERPVLRATLRRMTAEGLCEPTPGRGWRFVQVTAETIEQAFGFRIILEPAALLSAGYRVPVEALEGLRSEHLAVLERLDRPLAWTGLFDLDARFHLALAEGAGNPMVTDTIERQNRIRRLWEMLGYVRPERVRQSFDEHLGIAEALLAGDREWAAAQLRRHLQTSLRQTLTHFEADLAALREGTRAL